MHPPIYFDDLSIGDTFDSLSKTITESEIIDYAWKYDPQPFHISKTDAAQSPFGGLIASGFMTAAITFRLFHQSNGFQTTSVGGHGIDKLRWLKPVRPDDTLRARMEIVTLKPSRSRPDVGNALCRFSTLNQDGDVVMTMENAWILKRRPAS
jgi:acyl dehydratase